MVGCVMARWALVLCILIGSSAVRAQPIEEEVDARALFGRGVADVEAGRLLQAQQHFEASMAAEANIATVYNLSAVLQQLGKPVRCRDLAQEALGGRFGSTGERAEPFVRLLERCSASLARVSVVAQEGSVVTVNGHLRGAVGASSLTVDVDPGEHHLHVRIGEGEIQRTFRIAAGERRSFDFQPVADTPVHSALSPRNSAEESAADMSEPVAGNHVRRRRRIFIVLAVLAVVGAGIAVGVAASRSDESVVDAVWGNPQALLTF